MNRFHTLSRMILAVITLSAFAAYPSFGGGNFSPTALDFAQSDPTLTVRPLVLATPVLGDTNDDCVVDLIDLTYVAGHIGTSERRADFNGDGTVDQIDSDMLGAVYGTTCGTRLIGDTNGDGLVNLIDLAYLAAQMGTSDPVADFNGDGTVDQIDVDMLGANYGRNLGRRFLGDVNGDNIVDLIDLVTLSRALRPNHPLGDLNGDFVVDQVDVDLLGAQYGSISGADLLGDINGDKIVDQIDVDLLAAVYGTNWPQADINDDGTVDLIDFTMLSGEVGNIAARDLTGDVNGDWLVDQVDADLLGAVYGTSWPQADIDDSGVVDLIDLTLLSQNMDATFGTQCMGNINGDGEVDGTDLGILSAVYGTEYPQADLDGVPPVDIIDLTLLAQNTGNLCP